VAPAAEPRRQQGEAAEFFAEFMENLGLGSEDDTGIV
jgi:hypothetical protein